MNEEQNVVRGIFSYKKIDVLVTYCISIRTTRAILSLFNKISVFQTELSMRAILCIYEGNTIIHDTKLALIFIGKKNDPSSKTTVNTS